MPSHLQKMREGQQLESLKVNHTSGLFHSQACCPNDEFLTGRAADNDTAGVGVKPAHVWLCCAFSRAEISRRSSMAAHPRCAHTLCSQSTLGKCHHTVSFPFPLRASVLVTQKIQDLQPDAVLWTTGPPIRPNSYI